MTSAASNDPRSAMGLALRGRGAGRPLGLVGVWPTVDQGTLDPLSDLSLTGLCPGTHSPRTEQRQPGSHGPLPVVHRESQTPPVNRALLILNTGLASGTAAKATCGPASHVQVLGFKSRLHF